MSGSDTPRVLLAGEMVGGLVRAIAQMSAADLGPYAIVGGVAVAARLGQAHRVTRDVDTVVDQDHVPAAVAVLRGLPSATADPEGGPHRVLLEGTKVEVLEVAFKGRLVQYTGRILRPYPGKVTAEVHDYHDVREGVIASSLAKRASGYVSLGFPDPR